MSPAVGSPGGGPTGGQRAVFRALATWTHHASARPRIPAASRGGGRDLAAQPGLAEQPGVPDPLVPAREAAHLGHRRLAVRRPRHDPAPRGVLARGDHAPGEGGVDRPGEDPGPRGGALVGAPRAADLVHARPRRPRRASPCRRSRTPPSSPACRRGRRSRPRRAPTRRTRSGAPASTALFRPVIGVGAGAGAVFSGSSEAQPVSGHGHRHHRGETAPQPRAEGGGARDGPREQTCAQP